jgi:Skp family chaperone for outer membrane proteins
MKAKVIAIGCLIGLLVLSCSYVAGASKPKPKDEPAPPFGGPSGGPKSRLGIMSVRKIFQTCKRNEKYKQQAKVEQDKAIEEMQQLRKDINAGEARLDALKPGTKDYLDIAQELAQKKALLPIKQNYYEQQFTQKDKDWTEQIYKDILSSVTKVAEEKGLEMVFEKDEPEFPFERPDELMLVIRTNKILYSSSGCVDITNDVMARIDANSP